MYEKFFGFTEKPFNIVPNPKFLYHSKKHENALTYLEYAMTEGAGFTLLTGGIGTGKTTLIRHVLNQVSENKNIAVVFNTNVNAEQLFHLILREFDIEPAPGDKAKNLELLNQFLIDCYTKKIDPILIIDEAQNLSHEALEEVRLLTNLQNDDQNLLQIILVGQPELKQKMEDPSLIQLNQRINVRYNLTELSEEETSEYISARLQTAGGNPELFDDQALSQIYNASLGVPRIVNLICDSSLVYAYADEAKIITEDIVKQVITDQGTLVSQKAIAQDPFIETRPSGVATEERKATDITATESKLINLAKHFKRFQADQERQHGLIDEEIAEITLLVERERRKSLLLETQLKSLASKKQDDVVFEDFPGLESDADEKSRPRAYGQQSKESIFKKFTRFFSG